ncbi:hypothetical protein MMSR116_19285 [Methylobacterium mesophilicum SR1.6/6]|uniref:Curlin n=1 Tax=Methylobacterium mesophilicum SR1.6/6 TaxID=908290 RepID=A0A6B9FRW4_9HYPH|nr:curlin repeat-containing protein [Methylobacterium mesophilicum]QGY03798.1 hypothetical protein MMSR116_19285 [Methylobacterium mesophilicum SR1.6/6]
MGIQFLPAQPVAMRASSIALAFILVASQTANSSAADQRTKSAQIDLRQEQASSPELDPDLTSNPRSAIQDRAISGGHHRFWFRSGANTSSFDFQSGPAAPLDIERSGSEAPGRSERSASGNPAATLQVDLALLLVTQRDVQNEINVSQSGSNNLGVLVQSGSHNSIVGYQNDANNSVTLVQSGVNQIIGYAQTGSGSLLTIRQH